MVMIKTVKFNIPNKNGKGYVGKWWGKYVLPKFKVLTPQTIEVALIDRERYYFAYLIDYTIDVEEWNSNLIFYYNTINVITKEIIDKYKMLVMSLKTRDEELEVFNLDNVLRKKRNKYEWWYNGGYKSEIAGHVKLTEEHIKFIKNKLTEYYNNEIERIKKIFEQIKDDYKKYIELKDKFIKFIKKYVENKYNVKYSKIIWKEEDSTVKSSEGFPEFVIKCPKCHKAISSYKEKEDIPKLIKHCNKVFYIKSSSRWWDEDVDWGLHSSDGEEYYSSVILKWIDKVEPLSIQDYIEIAGGSKKLLFKFYKEEMGEEWELKEKYDIFEEYISSKGRKLTIEWGDISIYFSGDLKPFEIKLFRDYLE